MDLRHPPHEMRYLNLDSRLFAVTFRHSAHDSRQQSSIQRLMALLHPDSWPPRLTIPLRGSDRSKLDTRPLDLNMLPLLLDYFGTSQG